MKELNIRTLEHVIDVQDKLINELRMQILNRDELILKHIKMMEQRVSDEARETEALYGCLSR